MDYPPPGNDPSPPPRSSRKGLGDLAASTLAALIDHILIRIKLFQLEASEVRGELLVKTFLLLTSFLFFAIGYVALLAGVVAMLIIHYQWPWAPATTAVGGIHIFVAFLLFIIARKRLSHTAFQDTLREIEKDRQWLKDRHRQD